MRRRIPRMLLALLVLAAVAPAKVVVRAQAAGHTATADTCVAPRPGSHDPRAEITFSASVSKKGRAQTQRGARFDYGTVRDLKIEVRWQHLQLPARQRLELYAPDGHLYQMIPQSLPAHPDPVVVTVPVAGTQIEGATMAGIWCVKVFLDSDPDPVAAEDFELRFIRQ